MGNCKLKNANCKLRGRAFATSSAGLVSNLKFSIFILQFAIRNFLILVFAAPISPAVHEPPRSTV